MLKNTKKVIKTMKNKQNRALKLQSFEFELFGFSNTFKTCRFLHLKSDEHMFDQL